MSLLRRKSIIRSTISLPTAFSFYREETGDIRWNDLGMELFERIVAECKEGSAADSEGDVVQPLEIKDRTWRLRTFNQCFLGSDMHGWLMRNLLISGKEAKHLGEVMMENSIFEHVTRGHGFKNKKLFYRFCDRRVMVEDGELTELRSILAQCLEHVEVRNRQYKGVVYWRCFIASELVSHLVEGHPDLAPSREAAVTLVNRMRAGGLVEHVRYLKAHKVPFRDGYFFFRVSKDAELPVDAASADRIFGAQPLHIPQWLDEAVKWMDEHGGWAEEGIFRISANKVELDAFVAAVEAGNMALPSDGDTSLFHVVAGAIKLYLRELPEPLFTFSLYVAFLDLDPKDDGFVPALANLIARLPPINHEMLRLISRICAKVCAASDTSRMDANNLSVVFAPNVLYPPDPTALESFDSALRINDIFRALITDSSVIFPEQ